MFILRGAHWIPYNDSDTMSSWGWAQVLFEVPPSLPPHGRRYSEDRQEKSSNSVWLIFRYEASGSKVRYLISFEPFNMTMYIQCYTYIKIHIYEKIWIEIYISMFFSWTLPCSLSRFLFCLVIVFSAMFVPGGLTYIAEEKNGRTDHKMDHLACFVGESRFTRIVGRDSGWPRSWLFWLGDASRIVVSNYREWYISGNLPFESTRTVLHLTFQIFDTLSSNTFYS